MPNAHHERVLRFFAYDHLPPVLQHRSRRFAVLAANLTEECERDDLDPAETTVALRKLLEAKDAAVRAALKD